MRSETGLIQYKNKGDYLAKKPLVANKGAPPKSVDAIGQEAATKSDLSSDAKQAAKNISDVAAKMPPTPPLSVVADLLPELPSTALEEIKEAPAAPEVETKALKIKDQPAIIFIKGLSLFSSSGDGLEDMASAIPKSEVYSWGEKDEAVESILKRPRHQPVIVVGHSLGGDTAVEVAQELNQVANGFRTIDLLVTLDSVGFNNDIIPQNVKTNLNFIGDDWYGINDSPNIARNTDYTAVINELREDGHRGIENNEEVQLKIFERVDAILKNAVAQRAAPQLTLQAHKDLKGISIQ